MIITFKELNKIFRLSDDVKDRQIKKGLLNKIIILNKNEVEIINEELSSIVRKLKNDEVLTINEAANMLKVSKYTVFKLAELSKIPYYKLVSEKGSKILFLKSELQSLENINTLCLIKIEDINSKQKKYNRLLSSIIDKFELKDNVKSIFNLYIDDNFDIQKVADSYGLTKERIRQIIERTIYCKIPLLINNLFRHEKTHNELFEDYWKIKNENEKLRQIVNDKIVDNVDNVDKILSNYEKLQNAYNLNIKDFDISIRLNNIFKAYEIEKIRDVIHITFFNPNNILNLKHFGKKTFAELMELLLHLKFNFKTEIPKGRNYIKQKLSEGKWYFDEEIILDKPERTQQIKNDDKN